MLHRQNQTLEDNTINIQQRHQEATPTEDMEMLDPQTLSNEIWEHLSIKVPRLTP